jgi:hypothetical protein
MVPGELPRELAAVLLLLANDAQPRAHVHERLDLLRRERLNRVRGNPRRLDVPQGVFVEKTLRKAEVREGSQNAVEGVDRRGAGLPGAREGPGCRSGFGTGFPDVDEEGPDARRCEDVQGGGVALFVPGNGKRHREK